MHILAIETSCDETALAVVECTGTLENPSARIVESLIASQVAVHAPFGGVVPNLAKREHLKNLPALYENLKASRRARLAEVDAVAVTVGPGLEPALWTGIEFAESVARELRKPLLGVNHLEGHLWSFLFSPQWKKRSASESLFPAVALIVSGGHTILLSLESFSKVNKLGETRDDAAGEAFDKVARLLSLPYPGGPELERLARLGDPNAIPFPRPMAKTKSYDMSFSGLKTSVLYYLRDEARPAERSAKGTGLPEALRAKRRKAVESEESAQANVAASFQAAVIDVLQEKTLRAACEYGARTILLSGGVSANAALRTSFRKTARAAGLTCLLPPSPLNTDNAAMIAASAYLGMLKKKTCRIVAQPNLNL